MILVLVIASLLGAAWLVTRGANEDTGSSAVEQTAVATTASTTSGTSLVSETMSVVSEQVGLVLDVATAGEECDALRDSIKEYLDGIEESGQEPTPEQMESVHALMCAWEDCDEEAFNEEIDDLLESWDNDVGEVLRQGWAWAAGIAEQFDEAFGDCP